MKRQVIRKVEHPVVLVLWKNNQEIRYIFRENKAQRLIMKAGRQLKRSIYDVMKAQPQKIVPEAIGVITQPNNVRKP